MVLNKVQNWYFWEELLRTFDIIKERTTFEVLHSLDHHVFHMYCAKATTGDNEYFGIIDGGGDHKQWEGNDYYEQESLYKSDEVILKKLYTEANIHPFGNTNWKIKLIFIGVRMANNDQHHFKSKI